MRAFSFILVILTMLSCRDSQIMVYLDAMDEIDSLILTSYVKEDSDTIPIIDTDWSTKTVVLSTGKRYSYQLVKTILHPKENKRKIDSINTMLKIRRK